MKKHGHGIHTLICLCMMLMSLQAGTRHAVAQSVSVTPIQCGNIIESSLKQAGIVHAYSLDLEAGDTLIIDINRISTANAPRVIIYDSNGGQLIAIPWEKPVQEVAVPYSDRWILEVSDRNISSYVLSIGCKMRASGELIEAGTVPLPINETPQPVDLNSIPVVQMPAFLTSVAAQPMTILPDIPMTGVITDREVAIYNLTASASDLLSLTFMRRSGNLNLNLVVVSPDRQVIFQTSLVTSTEMSTRFALPSAGTYSISVYRVDLLPLTTLEPTAFEITAALNATP